VGGVGGCGREAFEFEHEPGSIGGGGALDSDGVHTSASLGEIEGGRTAGVGRESDDDGVLGAGVVEALDGQREVGQRVARGIGEVKAEHGSV
jgi:hypothetical protein